MYSVVVKCGKCDGVVYYNDNQKPQDMNKGEFRAFIDKLMRGLQVIIQKPTDTFKLGCSCSK